MKSTLMLNRFPPNQDSSFLFIFKIRDYDCSFGYLLPSTVAAIAWPDFWEVNAQNKTVTLLGTSLDERNKQLKDTLYAEHQKGTFKQLAGWTGEVFSVYGPAKELVVSIEKLAAPLFGIITYGVQLLVYRDDPDGLRVWIGRRAKTKRTFPSMLDSTVGGSLPTGETPFQCLIRESREEASIPEQMLRDLAKACGTVNYVDISDSRSGGELGLLTPEVQFTYEMRIGTDFIPKPGDNEAESITLFDVKELKKALGNGEFTPANGCIILDFFVRHGIINYENEEDYIEIASRLHRKHEFPTA